MDLGTGEPVSSENNQSTCSPMDACAQMLRCWRSVSGARLSLKNRSLLPFLHDMETDQEEHINNIDLIICLLMCIVSNARVLSERQMPTASLLKSVGHYAL